MNRQIWLYSVGFKSVSAHSADKEADMRCLAKYMFKLNAFLNILYASLQKVLAAIFRKVKEISSLCDQSVKLNWIEKFFSHALKQFSDPCKTPFILSLQLKRNCRREAVASLRKSEQNFCNFHLHVNPTFLLIQSRRI